MVLDLEISSSSSSFSFTFSYLLELVMVKGLASGVIYTDSKRVLFLSILVMMVQGQSSSMHLFQKRATLPVGSFAGSVSHCCRAIYVFLQQFHYHGFNMPWIAITGLLMRSPSTSTHPSTLGKTLLQRDPLQIWTFHVCFKDAIAQHSFLMWLAHLEKLPTRARLARWVSISPNLVAFAIIMLRKEIICFFVVSGLGIYGT